MKPELDLLPRQIWLRERTIECCNAVFSLSTSELEWDEFRKRAKELATELLYTVTEWENYYPED